MFVKRNEMDRPTNYTLEFVQRVKPHHITRDPWLVDPYVKESLEELIGRSAVEEFGSYTRSFYTLEGHYSNLWKYDQPITPPINDPIFDLAVQKARESLRLPVPVSTYNWERLKDVPYISSSSAGWGYIGKKGAPGNQTRAIERANAYLRWWLDMRYGKARYNYLYHPDLAWTRTQISEIDTPKIRHVWGKSFENIILEGISAAPLVQAYRDFQSPIVIGQSMYKRLPLIISKVLHNSDDEYRPNFGIGIDFKSFDTSPQEWLIDIAFDILEDNLTFSGYYEYESFNYSKYYFTHTPVVMPDGRLWRKHLGIPSGSYFTQLIGSTINLILMYYIQLKLYDQTFMTYVLGDDSLFGIPAEYGYPDLDQMAAIVSPLGFTIHPHKCIVANRPQELHFLGHYARHTRVDRDEAELMRMVLYPEYPVDGPTMSMSRVLGMMIDSALNSWAAVHLYRYMKAKYRNLIPDTITFTTDMKDWLVAVVGTAPEQHLLTESDIFNIT